jgi:hypothetical protein
MYCAISLIIFQGATTNIRKKTGGSFRAAAGFRIMTLFPEYGGFAAYSGVYRLQKIPPGLVSVAGGDAFVYFFRAGDGGVKSVF